MQLITTIQSLKETVYKAKVDDLIIGLVPTMGALHEGHTSLVERSLKECDFTVVSIFVNPTQFNNPTDLANYPRTIEADTRLLEQLGVNCVFAPSVEEIYPYEDTRVFDYPPITNVLEGPRRPGHFNGVCQIVSKLFELVSPNKSYFGEKDFQQIAVIKAMVDDMKIPLEVVPCPIVREATGLALSSRNSLLSVTEKRLAVNISRVLFISKDYARTHSVKATQNFVIDTLNALDGLNVEYFEIVDGNSLLSVSDWDESDSIVGCITVYCGVKPVRLIDNIRYK